MQRAPIQPKVACRLSYLNAVDINKRDIYQYKFQILNNLQHVTESEVPPEEAVEMGGSLPTTDCRFVMELS